MSDGYSSIPEFHCDPENDVCYRKLDFMGFPGYRVGDDGSVWNCSYHGKRGKGNGSGSVLIVGTVWKRRKSRLNNKSYSIFGLYRHYYRKEILVHCLVLEAFVGPRPLGMEGCHNDGDQQNNKLSNLRWDTPQGNAADKIKHGTSSRGEGNGNAVLTEDLVRIMRIEYDSGAMITQICRKYNKPFGAVRGAVTRARWKHVT
jgi:hypothetical protein